MSFFSDSHVLSSSAIYDPITELTGKCRAHTKEAKGTDCQHPTRFSSHLLAKQILHFCIQFVDGTHHFR